jgi:error-prone DNA polymerase
MVHPYIRRRRGREKVSYPHPSLEPILSRTLGVPLFQEQLLRMAMVAAGFSGSEAEELRRAFGFKRSELRMVEIEAKLRAGMTRQGIEGAAADEIVHAITAFALYGFPESHASSFALLAYASAWLKVRQPAAFYAALLNNQPMGFYHAATIVKDAQRHGLEIRPVDVTRSSWDCTVERGTVRLGLRYVTGLRETAGRAIVTAREARPVASVADLVARTGVNAEEAQTLAAVGALAALGGTRRGDLWAAAVPSPGPLFATAVEGGGSPTPVGPLRDMNVSERLAADYAGTGVTLGPHPLALRRSALARAGVVRAADLGGRPDGATVRVAGSVIVRQRPGTAKGFVFLSLEDETGIANVIVTPGVFTRNRLVLVTSPILLVKGILQSQDGVLSVRAATVQPISVHGHAIPSHDFG